MIPKQPKIGEMYDRITISRLTSGGRTSTGGFSGTTITELYTLWANVTIASYRSLRGRDRDTGATETNREYKIITRKGAVRKSDVVEILGGESDKAVVNYVRNINKSYDEITATSYEEQ